MFKKILFILIFVSITACGANIGESIKGGLTGKKKSNTDEFLVRKKAPLILPPNFDELPLPKDQQVKEEDDTTLKDEILSIEKIGKKTQSDGISSTLENSILKKIK
ncbi:MAG: hypothetical protein CBC24_07730 [Candidatus Pelagibacter sp. TMED64]|nr:hypothetical protein [Candidatus Pelagibacter sp.]OUU64092.1 MAG: hypothetical protein CBC24_07730 [Candidatus Pelagibacter sp. TMED64]|tara:strand:+ start:4221 stop:4538 length:318 start_codon:yes stop_codon:yes gene_type:complete